MVAGMASAGKSLVALWHAVHWVKYHGLRGVYLSADSSELGQAVRALCMATNTVTTDEADVALARQDEWAIKEMADLNNLVWSFENDLNYDTIHLEVEAFVELWGDTPDFIIIDNLTDVEGQSEDEWGTYRRVLKGLTQLARVSGAAVVVLHHTSEDIKFKGDPCPPRWAIMGKCAAKPALILTMADYGKTRYLACVKNRFGTDDRTGGTAIRLLFQGANLHFSEA